MVVPMTKAELDVLMLPVTSPVLSLRVVRLGRPPLLQQKERACGEVRLQVRRGRSIVVEQPGVLQLLCQPQPFLGTRRLRAGGIDADRTSAWGLLKPTIAGPQDGQAQVLLEGGRVDLVALGRCLEPGAAFASDKGALFLGLILASASDFACARSCAMRPSTTSSGMRAPLRSPPLRITWSSEVPFSKS